MNAINAEPNQNHRSLVSRAQRDIPPPPERSLAVPIQLDGNYKLANELHALLSELEARLEPVSRSESEPPLEPSPKPEPDETVMGRLIRNNEMYEQAGRRIRDMIRLLEI